MSGSGATCFALFDDEATGLAGTARPAGYEGDAYDDQRLFAGRRASSDERRAEPVTGDEEVRAKAQAGRPTPLTSSSVMIIAPRWSLVTRRPITCALATLERTFSIISGVG